MTQPSLPRSYFRQEATFWRDVYSSHKVEGAVYGTRFERALGLVDGVNLKPTAKVLEIGCGAGRFSLELARRGCDVVATDLVEEMLQMTRELAAEHPSSGEVRLSCADAGALPFQSHSFDMVVAIAILEWVRSSEQAMAEIFRVLRPGGYAIVSATNMWSVQRLLDPQLNPAWEPVKRWAKRSSARIQRTARARTHSAGELDELLKRTGFAKLDRLTAGYGPFTLFKRRLFPARWGYGFTPRCSAWRIARWRTWTGAATRISCWRGALRKWRRVRDSRRSRGGQKRRLPSEHGAPQSGSCTGAEGRASRRTRHRAQPGPDGCAGVCSGPQSLDSGGGIVLHARQFRVERGGGAGG